MRQRAGCVSALCMVVADGASPTMEVNRAVPWWMKLAANDLPRNTERQAGRYSQPFSLAMRAASTLVDAPSFDIASDR